MDPDTIGREFQEKTKYKYSRKPSDMVRGVRAPDPRKPVPEGTRVVPLPEVDPAGGEPVSFLRLLETRRSRRAFRAEPMTLEDLSVLLWATEGIVDPDEDGAFRTSPSAGARHPLETYLAINRVDGIQRGLYRYLPFEHALAVLSEEGTAGADLAAACLGQTMLARCGVAFAWTAVVERSRWKYQERGYRYIYLDAGHVCQNLYLAAEYLGLGCCAVGAFEDDAVNAILGVDGVEEFIVYLAAVGKRR